MRTRFWHPRIRRVFFAPPCLDAAAESAFQGSILHRKLLGRLSRRCYLGDDWGNHPAPAMTKRVPKLGARVLTCVDPLPCELGLVAFSWGVSVCCRNLLLSVSFLPWIAFCKIHGQMNVHNIHNSCAVKTGVGSWDIACACRKNTWYIIILSSFSLLNIHLGGVKMGFFLLPIFRHSHILQRKLRLALGITARRAVHGCTHCDELLFPRKSTCFRICEHRKVGFLEVPKILSVISSSFRPSANLSWPFSRIAIPGYSRDAGWCWLEHGFYTAFMTFHILGMSSSQLTNSYFSEG